MSGDDREALKARVLELFNAGRTASDVAEAVSREFGEPITRSVVLGIVHRNRDKVTRQPDARTLRSMARKLELREAQRLAEAEAAKPAGGRPHGALAATLALEFHHCRWPHNDPRNPDFYYCMAKRRPGSPYCLKHLREAAAPPAPPASQRVARFA